jgi:hypothetical protein
VHPHGFALGYSISTPWCPIFVTWLNSLIVKKYLTRSLGFFGSRYGPRMVSRSRATACRLPVAVVMIDRDVAGVFHLSGRVQQMVRSGRKGRAFIVRAFVP